MADSPSAVDRLMAALAAQRSFESSDARDVDGFLAEHADLRDLLEPMLRGADGDDAPAMESPPAEPDDGGDDGADDGADDGTGARMLGSYRLRGELGRGAMGIVHLAWHPELRREVALKVLPPERAYDPRAIARFRREASAMARLDHPGIVSVFEVGRDDGRQFFAMERLHGRPLDRVIAERSRDANDAAWRDQALEWCVQLGDALSYAHSRGVLHRDLKPANVMIEPDGRAVLTDFGLARVEELAGPGLTAEGQFAGTPYYCSPEQAAGRWHEVGPPSDVFALGVTLYELLALARPFEGETTHDVLHAIAERDPAPLQRRVPGISRDLAAVVHHAIAKDPLERYSSAAAFTADLRAVLDRHPVTVRHATAPQRAVRWARRSPVLAALVAVVALGLPLLTGLAGYVWASADEVAAGAQSLRRQAIEARLDRGYAHLAEGRLGAAWDAFDHLVQEEGALTEALAGELLVLGELLDPAPLAAWRTRWAAEIRERPVLHHVSEAYRAGDEARSWWRERTGWSATDCFVAASYCARRARFDDGGELRAEAVSLFEQACLSEPRLHHLCGLARAAAAAGDGELLAQTVEALERRYSTRAAALMTISEVLREVEPERALDVARRALATAPEDEDLRVHLARIELGMGHVDTARDRLDGVLGIRPAHQAALGARATIARTDGDLAMARELLTRAVAARATLRPAADAAVRTDDGGRPAIERLASATVHTTPRPDLALDLVEVLLELDEIEEAMRVLTQTRGAMPTFREPRAGIAQALVHAGRSDEAEELLRPVIEQGTRDPLPWLVWAKVRNAAEDYEVALQAADRALALRPDSAQAHYVRAVVLFNLMRLDDAIGAIEAAIELDPTAEPLSRMLVEVHAARRDVRGVLLEVERLAEALFQAGQPERAAEVLEPYRTMPPPAVLPEADEFGARIEAARRRYRAAADR